ncbi:MAG: LysR family transcriptional regulator [Synergistaceae bacterium]|jgi:DNA-binding transcriptional LysR family regulator|nr:LysR family transcriptional regulator [Synergistaceae bacterium]
MDLDYRILRYIMTVAEEGNISKAAQKLYLSQPSLSHSILKEERKLGVTLFDRTRQPLRLTYAGERYVMAARQILGIREKMEREMEDIARFRRGRLLIGVTKTHSAYLLPRVLPRFKTLYPDVELVLVEEITSSLESKLVTGKADVAILVSPAQNEHLASEYLCDEKILLCLPLDHPLAETFKREGVNLSLLKEETLILYKKGMILRKFSDVILAEAGGPPHVMLESQTAETIFNFVSAGLGWAFLPSSIVLYPSSAQIAYFTLGNPPMSFSCFFAWKRQVYLSQAARDFMKITKEILQKTDPIIPI